MKTDIIYMLDRSGSMGSIWDDAFQGLNQFIKDQKKIDGECDFSLVVFDNKYDIVIGRENIRDVQELESNIVTPRGSTSLLDAIGRTLTQYRAFDKNKVDEKVIVIIMTDGLENTSWQYNKLDIKRLIKEKMESGWEFIFMGADQDAFAEAGSLNIKAADTLNYAKSKEGILRATGFASAQTVAYRS